MWYVAGATTAPFPRLLQPCHGTWALLPSNLAQLVHAHRFMEIRAHCFFFLFVAQELLHIQAETRHSEGFHL